MKKRFTLLSTALLMGTSLSVFAQEQAGLVDKAEWKEGNYFYLKSANSYLALDAERTDSVLVRNSAGETKDEIDLALWQIKKVETTAGGDVYQFTNKATKAVLSFSTKANATTVLDPSGVSQWTFTGGKIVGYYGDSKTLALSVSDSKLTLASTANNSFTVELPISNYLLKANELGDGISTFILNMGGNYTGDIFKDKELVATNLTGENKDYMSLQIKGDEYFDDGKAKYLGVDTLYTEISGAKNAFGFKFVADSTYKGPAGGGTHTWGNEAFQKFKFTIDLKNDSVAMFVKQAPSLTSENKYSGNDVQVVYATLGDNKVLTVSETNPLQGTAPFITTRRGTPVTLANGSGVYFLKNVGKTANAGKYLYGNEDKDEKYEYVSETPSVYNPDGQWYVKEENGKYSIVDRLKGTTYASNSEIFAVNGVSGAYTVAGRTDTLSFEYQPKVDLKDKYLGSLYFTEAELKEKAIQLNLQAVDGVVVPISVSDSVLFADTEEDAKIFGLEVKEKSVVGGAKVLGDTLYAVSYHLKDQFGDRYLVKDEESKSLIVSAYQQSILDVVFESTKYGDTYEMKVGDEYVTYNTKSNLLLLGTSEEAFKFKVDIIDAPQYETVESSHLRFGSNGKYLTMNPLTLWAELKNEGQEITKADYTADNFSFKIEKADTVIPGKPVYLISTCMIGADDETSDVRYYLSAIDTVQHEGKNRLGFIPSNDTIRTSKNSPAYFSLKKNEDGSLWLENINVKGGAFVSQIANTLVMSNTGMNFSVEKASAPTANEEIEAPTSVVVAGGHNSVTVMNAKDKKIVLTDILGKIVGNYLVTSDRFTVPASRGLLIVAIEGEVAQKVIVK
ncbi:DUF6383 domain-containing protein [Parabacteroides sp. AGMB00274]|uniref:DUF6383 domain-containing protein n=1 Tax=Parabacteroides faecalis TaxID=2924040 RepID=A0ABT0C3Y5_9BACT|nr:DUF6383 domain-containing protein [Parabacteroides faecalis]MCJ2381732.1 DUF6383 domain-containing protein [Parabacteroides faecalis]